MPHRQLGSGDHTVRIAPRTDQGGIKVFLGRALYQAAGSPERIDLSASHGVLRLTAGEQYAVAGIAVGGQPRLSVGRRVADDLGLSDAPGTYEARWYPRSKRLLVRLSLHATRIELAEIMAMRQRLGLTQSALAGLLGVPYGTYRNWEQRHRRPHLSPEQQQRVRALLEQIAAPP